LISVHVPRYVAWKRDRLVGHDGLPRRVMAACLAADSVKGLSLFEIIDICKPRPVVSMTQVIDALVEAGLLYQINGKATRHGIR
jgi:hypothetical protein